MKSPTTQLNVLRGVGLMRAMFEAMVGEKPAMREALWKATGHHVRKTALPALQVQLR